MDVTSSSHAFSYHVFLSFRGSDTRHGFTGHLYKALCDKGIYTFIDDEELQRGEEITPSLVKAIQESRIAIIVLSKDYASSSFCLDELATIIDCKSKGMLVIPVFYKVDPSDVRHQKGNYGDAIAKHEKRFKHNMDKLQKWKMALHQVANLSGYHLEDRVEYEYKFIGGIVASVSEKINHPARLRVEDYLVGLDSRVAEVMKVLDVRSDDGVHMIGIHGMGGVGKSTLARAVYNNLISEDFDGLCFLENIREESNKHGLQHLQSILLSKIVQKKFTNLTSWREGASIIEDRLQRKKVLLVLDDVDKDEQLQAIVGSPNWFGLGSKVIITTRDEQLLKSHEIERRYEVKELNKKDALELLTWKAFKKEKADATYVDVLNRVLTYASGLPLALEVIGSNLFGKNIETWESAINQYKRIPHNRIQYILKVSFDALQEEEKSVFLDIACCFKGLAGVQDILHAHYGCSMKYQIGVLVEKSLIKHNFPNDSVTLHDLIEDMGKEIVRQESPEEPEKRSRLWLPKDIIQVLKDNTGTCKIKIIYLDFHESDQEETIEWDGNAFKEMKNLKILIIKNVNFSEGPKCLPNSLTVLEWWRYPSHCLPYDFQPRNLVICKLISGCLTSFVLDWLSKKLVNVRVLKFVECKFLTQMPDVSDLQNLKELSLRGCVNLNTVHNSIGFLDKLEILDALGCCKLRSFPPIRLPSLKILNFTHCSSLLNFPEILGKMENIKEVWLDDSFIKELPSSFQYLIGLRYLSLSNNGIVELPSSILMMPELAAIYGRHCKALKWVKQEKDEEKVGSIVSSNIIILDLPSSNLYDDFFSMGFTRFVHLLYLILPENNITFLPECIKDFKSLKIVNVDNCKHLEEIRGVPPNIRTFTASNCRSLTSSSSSMFINQVLNRDRIIDFCLTGTCIPEWFDLKSRGPSTSFWFRNNFPHNVLCLLIAPVKGYHGFTPMVFINGKVHEPRFLEYENFVRIEMDHTYIFELNWTGLYDQFEVSLEYEWKHVEVTYAGIVETSIIKGSGIHLFKKESNNDDIRFTDPYSKRKLPCDLNNSESQNQPLSKRRRSVIPIWKFHRYNFWINKKKKKRNQKKKNE